MYLLLASSVGKTCVMPLFWKKRAWPWFCQTLVCLTAATLSHREEKLTRITDSHLLPCPALQNEPPFELGEQSGREVCLQHQWRDCCASRSAGSGLLFTKNWENGFCRASELG